MNKMAKGALAIGVGAALLLGGGGTLAVWNDTDTSKAGTIASGDLDLTAKAGTWTSNISGVIPAASVATYKIVPGEKLTYTQKLDVKLEGKNLSANLVTTGGPTNGAGLEKFTDANIAISPVSLKNGANDVANPLTTSVTGIDASVSFEFKSTTAGRDSVNAKYDFATIGFELKQNAPVAPVAP